MPVLSAPRVHLGSGPAAPALVVVEDGRISDVRPVEGPLPAGTEQLGDVTVLPGLVDAHVHLLFDAAPDVLTPLLRDSDDELLARAGVHAQRALAAGITTARDLGDRRFLSLELRERTRVDMAAGPELLVAGPPITRTRGHCWFLGGEADTVPELEAAVRERAERGCDVVKVMATGGVITPGYAPHESQYDAAHLTAVVEQAHAVGLRVAAHAHGPDGIRDCVEVGVDSIEHCTWFSADGVEPDWEVAERMLGKGIVVGVTLGVLPGTTPPPAIATRLQAFEQNLQRMLALGLTVVCGSDAGIAPSKPHDVLPEALISLLALGIPFDEVLATATTTAAEACGVGDRKGRIAAGFDADLLVVRGSPERDASALREVERVYRGGVRVR